LSALGAHPADSPAQTGPAIVTGRPDVVVVGAGAFGAWTALTLRERGVKVVLLDAYGVCSPRATSYDETRLIRCGYGDREIYSRWALRAMDLWEKRQQEWNQKLLYPGTRLSLAAHSTRQLELERKVFDRLSIRYEILQHDELSRRYPQVSFEGVEAAFLEPRSALIKAQDALLRVAEEFKRKGGTIQIGRAALGRASGRQLEAVSLGGNESVAAGSFVFACGPWLRKVFPDVLGKTIVTPRVEVVYFGPPSGDARFSWPNFPYLNGSGFSLYPCIDRGIKVLPVTNTEADPDAEERVVTAAQVKRARDYVALRVPALKDQPVVATHVCQFEMTKDQHFLIDTHPQFDNVWFAGGGSSHGFKHGPVIGEYVSDRVTGIAGDPELQKIFALRGR